MTQIWRFRIKHYGFRVILLAILLAGLALVAFAIFFLQGWINRLIYSCAGVVVCLFACQQYWLLLSYEKHAWTLYSFKGQHLPHGYEKENLLHLLMNRETYLVDTNFPWPKLTANIANKDKAFVFGRTHQEEKANRYSFYFENWHHLRQGNGYLLATDDSFRFTVCIERFDKYFGRTKSKRKVRIASLSEDEKRRQIPDYEDYSDNRAQSFKVAKKDLLERLGISHIDELDNRRKFKALRVCRQAVIKIRVPFCRGDYLESTDLAADCFALLLIESKHQRNEFKRDDKPHFLHDTILLRDAIYLGCGILTDDIDLTRMAERYCGLPVKRAKDV